jgi:hypothetical protein
VTYKGGGSAGPSIAAVIEQADATVPQEPDSAIGVNAYLPAEGVAVPLPEWRPQK